MEEPMTEIQVFTDSQLAHRVVMLKAFADVILDALNVDRDDMASRMAKGDRVTARDGDVKLGSMSLSDPKPVAKVTDNAAFEDYLSIKYGDEAERRFVWVIRRRSVRRLLNADRDDLFEVVETFPAWVRKAGVDDALIPGRTVPGVTVTVPPGVLSVRTADAAVEAVKSAITSSGVLAIEGGE
ncbi:hypothetical protein GS539_19275 [Rhodococcus hoagii]|nr:hypothetical protein [Prescottella equi]